MNQRMVLIGAGVLVVLAAGILLGRHFFPVTHRQASAPSGGNVLLAPAPQLPDTNLLRVEGETQPAPQEPQKRPPDDIIDYLQHLRKVETQRQAMQRDLTPAFNAFVNAIAMRATIDEQELQQRMSAVQQAPQDYSQKWSQLSQFFESKLPPPACQPLHEAYRKMLASTIAYMTKVYLALQQAQTDPNAALQVLSQMQGTASTDVDTQILQANYELQQILDKYDLRRYFPGFVISGDAGLNLRSIFGG
ncbi:MAG: hypothetical protein RMM08_06630 [Armatimonadota bacterium]|nr:hypothetical protein [bacterium]MDW8321018.1 hypothetical protein [Armatimonadota bacterium]